MNFDDFEDMIYEKIHKVLLKFRYSTDQQKIFKKMVNEQMRQDILEDLEKLCNERNRSWIKLNEYNVRKEVFDSIYKKYSDLRNYVV